MFWVSVEDTDNWPVRPSNVHKNFLINNTGKFLPFVEGTERVVLKVWSAGTSSSSSVRPRKAKGGASSSFLHPFITAP